MTGTNLEIVSQIVLWYENSFRIDCWTSGNLKPVDFSLFLTIPREVIFTISLPKYHKGKKVFFS